MKFQFFTFNYTELIGTEIKSTDDVFYCTSGDLNINEMKAFVRQHIINNPSATLTIQKIEEISKEQYESKTGKIFL